jgi:spermidine synthase
MQYWYTEEHTSQVKFSIKVNERLHSEISEFQHIEVFEADEFGRFLTLDGIMMMTEKDEFIYHEMIVHVPMAVIKDVKNILVIGGGDGGTVRELARYKTISQIDLVEIDPLVVEVSKKYLPSTAIGFDDDRVKIFYADGCEYIKGIDKKYDLIIVDSTDPIGPGEGLFTKEFYGNCYRALKENGAMVNQHESPFYEEDAREMLRAHQRIMENFPIGKVYQAHIPTYSSGHWLFGFASKDLHPVHDFDAAKWNTLGIKTRYYNTQLHLGAFALPTYVEEMLKEVE